MFRGREPPATWLRANLRDADAFVVPPYFRVDRAVLELAPRLKLVGIHGSGN